MRIATSMVHVNGTTYRIARLRAGYYQVVRVLDDAVMGHFSCGARLDVEPNTMAASDLQRIAQAARQQAKTSWMGSLPITH